MTGTLEKILESRSSSSLGTLFILLLIALAIIFISATTARQREVQEEVRRILLREAPKPPEPKQEDEAGDDEESPDEPDPYQMVDVDLDNIALGFDDNFESAAEIASVEPEAGGAIDIGEDLFGDASLGDVDIVFEDGPADFKITGGGAENEDGGGGISAVVSQGNPGGGTGGIGDIASGGGRMRDLAAGRGPGGGPISMTGVGRDWRPADALLDELAEWLRNHLIPFCHNVENIMNTAPADDLTTIQTFEVREDKGNVFYALYIQLREQSRTLSVLLVDLDDAGHKSYHFVDQRKDRPQSFKAGASLMGQENRLEDALCLRESRLENRDHNSPDALKVLNIFHSWWNSVKDSGT